MSITIYRSSVWWGWINTRHARSFRWGVLYLGRIGIAWTLRR